MKTIIYILTTLFVMNVKFLFAGDPKLILLKDNPNSASISMNISELAPVTPKEANFNDYDLLPSPAIIRLAPITPKEATFEDSDSESIQSINPCILQNIVPSTPKEAEFEDSPIDTLTGIDVLAPISPKAATFEE